MSYYPREYYIGEEALQLRGVLKLMFPMSRGIIEDFSAIERMLYFTFYTEFRIDPAEQIILFPYNPFWSRPIQEKVIEILFETFNTEGVFFVDFYKLVLELKNIPHAIIIDCIDDCVLINTYINYQRKIIGCKSVDIGFRDTVHYMMRLLRQKGYSFITSAEREIVRDIVEKTCYIALDPEQELSAIKEPTNYMQPDGEGIPIRELRFLAPESFFNVNVLGKEDAPTHIVLKEILENNNLEDFHKNNGIILWDGVVPHMPNFIERITKELAPVKINPSQLQLSHYYKCFESIYNLDLKNYFNELITKFMYKTFGPSYVCDLIHRNDIDEEGKKKND